MQYGRRNHVCDRMTQHRISGTRGGPGDGVQHGPQAVDALLVRFHAVCPRLPELARGASATVRGKNESPSSSGSSSVVEPPALRFRAGWTAALNTTTAYPRRLYDARPVHAPHVPSVSRSGSANGTGPRRLRGKPKPPEAETIISSAARRDPARTAGFRRKASSRPGRTAHGGLWPGPVPQGSAIPLTRSSARIASCKYSLRRATRLRGSA